MRRIVRCVSCDGFGWLEDEETGQVTDCEWCAGVGYVYRDEQGVDYRIPEGDYTAVAGTLEALEAERLREMGYTGGAKRPWEQAIRGENAHRLRGGSRDDG
jgi:hypothetical protein